MESQKMLILASTSPRRREYIRLLDRPFVCEKPHVSEEIQPGLAPEEMVMELARRKAEEVASRHTEGIIIGADTVVVLQGEILGKPRDEQDAAEMLRRLSGKIHKVFTGFCVMGIEKSMQMCNYKVTKVKMSNLTDEQIQWYIHTKEPFDKAGSYAIQGYGARFIEAIEGCFFNVVGFPIQAIYEMISKIEQTQGSL